MLTAAVGLTLIGFVLLVIALMNANFALAVACIAVCVVGLLVLLYDTIRANRRGRAGVEDEPLFTIRGRESASRAEPLIDDDSATTADQASTADQAHGTDQASVDESAATGGPHSAGARTAGFPATGGVDEARQAQAPTSDTTWKPAAVGGLGSVVSPDAHGNGVGTSWTGEPSTGPTPTQTGPQTGQVGTGETGDANDYIRSVTGSFPAQTGQQSVADPEPYAPGTPAPQATATPAAQAPGTGTFPGSNAETSAPAPSGPPTDTGSLGAADGSSDPESAGYVGRRRRIEQSENVVVNTSDPTLPAMQFVYRDSDDDAASESGSGTDSDGKPEGA
ncbi:hypothetical protein L5G32_10850 [Gordonia sp. HY002]|uniref:hypothetical protein n=1 Tax=Gordonia zhenghanii TaxID=2911516 RepID=UPI001EF0FFE7|nr:hypothetical protein [Gordonia zhenghanii]MCF8570765.1 hypothetical protein [Gordonia zhenghanii]MCF8603800.1 hypothetical protein [Gordonia zhenghanii]